MRSKIVYLISILALWQPVALAASVPAIGTTDVFFSPKGGCTEAIISEINKAKTEILLQAYSFTSAPICISF